MKRPWLLYSLACTAIAAVMTWASVKMLELERSETQAKHEKEYQGNVWSAIDAMDTWVESLLQAEKRRPVAAYQAFSDVRNVYAKKDLMKVDEELSTPSPLLREKSPFIRLHFQIDAAGEFSSPQVPQSNYQELAVPALMSQQAWVANSSRLASIRKTIDRDSLRAQVERAVEQQRAPQQAGFVERGFSRKKRPETKEPFGAFWEDGELYFVRRVERGGQPIYQGFLANWSGLREALRAEIGELYPNASLRAATISDVSHRLYRLPVVLSLGAAPPMSATMWTATHTVLAVVWGVVLVTLAAFGFAIKRFIEYGLRQRRFASMVTHELRSPLTTFRLYADLLAEKLVADPQKTDEYHKSLQDTSAHMARMVENVIVHSRLEEGRAKLTPARQTVQEMLSRFESNLVSRAGRSGLPLEIDAPEQVRGTELHTDSGAVGQILHNLIENACKYGRSEHRPAIDLSVRTERAGVRITVRDFGEGISPRYEPMIFKPFERGGRNEADPERGLGLGLPLCRGLARDLGGTLEFVRPSDGAGAAFVLELPYSPSGRS